MTEAAPTRTRSLVRRLALWIGLSTALSLLVFAVAAYALVILQEQQEAELDPPDVIAREARTEVGGAMLLAAPVALALAFAGATILTRQTLRPLQDVVGAAARINPRALDQRLPVPATNDEVRTVVLALNSLLDRLETGFAALGRFAAEASHELRTPLAVVATELEVMLRQPRTPEDWARSAATSLDEVRHLTRLVEALLEMARAEGAPEIERAPVELSELVVQILDAEGSLALGRAVRVQAPAGTPPGGTMAIGNAAGLASALSNVIRNAIQYTPGGGEVELSWRDEGPAIVLQVDDSGPGVDPTEAERIFEPFARGAAGRAIGGDGPGCGLGLTIARRILARNEASIHVGRSPLGGARFSVRFRRAGLEGSSS